jgi:hypothetical protein
MGSIGAHDAAFELKETLVEHLQAAVDHPAHLLHHAPRTRPLDEVVQALGSHHGRQEGILYEIRP